MKTEETRPSILIVEDQKNWRDVLRLTLQKYYKVDTVQDLKNARHAVFGPGRPYHAAIIDVRLDDLDRSNQDGLELAREIHERLDGLTSTVLITAYPSMNSIQMALRDLCVYGYLEKYPREGGRFDLATFQNTVQGAVEQAVRTRDKWSDLYALIVEDEKNWQDILSKILQQEGLMVHAASSVEDACAQASEWEYALIVIDLQFGCAEPEEGLALLDILKGSQPTAKFIIVTGYGTTRLALEAFSTQHRSYVEGFFEKYPFDQRQFLDAVRRTFFSRSHRQMADC